MSLVVPVTTEAPNLAVQKTARGLNQREHPPRLHRRAVDQRRQTGDALDTAVVPSLPGERSPPATQCAGLQPG